jgi:hypothetical protein
MKKYIVLAALSLAPLTINATTDEIHFVNFWIAIFAV